MRTLLLAFALILNCSNVLGYQKSKMNLSDLEYNKYVKRQFRYILSDFNGLVKNALTNKEVFFQAHKHTQELFKSFQRIEEDCRKLGQGCRSSLSQILRSSIELERALYQYGLEELEKTHCKDLKHNDCLTFTEIFSNLDAENSKLKDMVYATSQLKVNGPLIAVKIKSIRQSMFKTNYFWEQYLLASMGKRYREDYRNLFISFVHPIHGFIFGPDQKKDRFMQKVDGLNSSLNRFYRNLSKDNMKATAPERRIIGTIHRRWNSILKIVLR